MIINTTPHDIVIRSESGVDTSIPQVGDRCEGYGIHWGP